MLFETRQQFLFTERRDAFRLAERVHFVDNVLPYSYVRVAEHSSDHY